MSLYGPAEERTEAKRFKCGRQLPGAAVGQPMIPVVECQQNQFELLFGPLDPTTKQRTVTTHCVGCHGQDTLRLLTTNAGGPELPLFAAQIPALLAQRANPAMLVCRSCGMFRFGILDEGNELRRRCATCGDTRHLGYETKVGGKHRRTFA